VKVAFLLPVASDARYRKRIEALQNVGVKSQILAFERNYYSGKPVPGGYESLGRIQHRRYLRRLVPLVKALSKVRAAAKNADAIYTFGLDMLLLGWLASRGLSRRLKIVYEVGDIRNVLLQKGLISCSLRWLERFLLRRTQLIVVTAEAYVSGYYKGIQGLTDLRYQVIENKLDANTLPQAQRLTYKHSHGVLRIGYFGLIRCQRSWEILKAAARKGEGKIKVHVRGIPLGLENLEEEAEAIPYIDYGGPYVSPDDLPEMYGQIDIAWVAHYHGRSNLLWARANRFYEACHFQRPMIAQIGTQDSRVVQDLGLGICLDLSDIEGTVEHILEISDSDLEQWQGNIRRLPKYVYTYTDEHKRLLEFLET